MKIRAWAGDSGNLGVPIEQGSLWKLFRRQGWKTGCKNSVSELTMSSNGFVFCSVDPSVRTSLWMGSTEGKAGIDSPHLYPSKSRSLHIFFCAPSTGKELIKYQEIFLSLIHI